VVQTVEERFWPKVDKDAPGGCWLWTAATANGYGRFSIGPAASRVLVQSHVFAYELRVSRGLVLDHLCRVKRCVNPRHLEPVTISVNALRGDLGSRRLVCRRGHRDDWVTEAGVRRCGACRLEKQRAFTARRQPPDFWFMTTRDA
jgi:hypothetical protein